jgi:hypothetical protein
MFTVGSFAIALSAILGCVWWACAEDRDKT